MAIHRVFIDAPGGVRQGDLTVEGEEAHHAARVKRLASGDPVEVLDGRGGVGLGRVEDIRKGGRGQWELRVAVHAVHELPPTTPRVEVWSAVPKGSRLEDLVAGISQVGAARWRPLECRQSVVEPREGKRARIERVAAEASKQCGRPWLMEVGPPAPFAEALAPAPGIAIVMADAGGPAYAATRAPAIRLLVGPEGGWTDDERAATREAGVKLASFGPHTMRVETAALVGCAVILDLERRG